MQKSAAGETPSAQELAALKRIEKAQEEADRWRYYHSIPQKHWATMSGRQPKILAEQAGRYGLPFGGALIDLQALAKAFHDFLAANAASLAQAIPGIGLNTPLPEETTKALSDGTDPLAVTRAAMMFASKRLAHAAGQGLAASSDFENLKKALQEMRQMEQAQIDLRLQRRELMTGDECRQMVGEGCTVALRCIENLTNALGPELAIWISDDALRALPADQRADKVRRFVEHVCREVRQQASRDWIAWMSTLVTTDD